MDLSLSLLIPRCDEDMICSPQLSQWYHDGEVSNASKVDVHPEDMDQDKHDDRTDDRILMNQMEKQVDECLHGGANGQENPKEKVSCKCTVCRYAWKNNEGKYHGVS